MYKVPGGKLLKIALEEKNGVITALKITGDFFAHPEEHIELLENALAGAPITKEALGGKIEQFLRDHPTHLLGVDVDSLVSTILLAHSQ